MVLSRIEKLLDGCLSDPIRVLGEGRFQLLQRVLQFVAARNDGVSAQFAYPIL